MAKLGTITAAALALMAWLPPAPAAADEEYTGEEKTRIEYCVGNITEKAYSPGRASQCLDYLHADNYALLEKLKREDSALSARLLKYQTAFKELGEYYSGSNDMCRNRHKLLATLEGSGCALCTLTPPLGPQPTLFLPWVQTHAPDQLGETRSAAMEWESLPPRPRVTLSSASYSAETWSQKTLAQRMATLTADDILNSRSPNFYEYDQKGCRAIRLSQEDLLKHFLDPGMSARLQAYRARLGAATEEGKTSAAAMDAKTSRMAGLQGSIKGRDAEAQFAGLGSTFDGSVQRGPGSIADFFGLGSGKKYTLTDEEAAKLAPRLQAALVGGQEDGVYQGGELKGTKVGDDMLKFFNQKGADGKPLNPVDLKVVKLDSEHTGADYCPARCEGGCGGCTVGQIRLNKTMIEAWMKDKGISAEKLLDEKNGEHIARLSRHVAPTFVHEATHQKQDRWARDNGIPDKYHLDQEVQTFGAQSLFLKEKLANKATEAAYMKDLRGFDDTVLRKIEEGGYSKLKQFVRYYNLHGMEGTASAGFNRMEGMLKETGLRRSDPSYAAPQKDVNCWEGNPRGCTTASLQAMIDKTFPWYQKSVTYQRQNIEALNGGMDELNKIDNSRRYRTIAVSAPTAI